MQSPSPRCSRRVFCLVSPSYLPKRSLLDYSLLQICFLPAFCASHSHTQSVAASPPHAPEQSPGFLSSHLKSSWEGGMAPERMDVKRVCSQLCSRCSRMSFELFKGSSPQMEKKKKKREFLIRFKPFFSSQIKSTMTQTPIKASGRVLQL